MTATEPLAGPAPTEEELVAEAAKVFEELLDEEVYRPLRERARFTAEERLRGAGARVEGQRQSKRDLGFALILDAWPDCPIPPMGNRDPWYVPKPFQIDADGIFLEVFDGRLHRVCSPLWPFAVAGGAPPRRVQQTFFGARKRKYVGEYEELRSAAISVAVKDGRKWKVAEIAGFDAAGTIGVLERAGLRVNADGYVPKNAADDYLALPTAGLVVDFLLAGSTQIIVR